MEEESDSMTSLEYCNLEENFEVYQENCSGDSKHSSEPGSPNTQGRCSEPVTTVSLTGPNGTGPTVTGPNGTGPTVTEITGRDSLIPSGSLTYDLLCGITGASELSSVKNITLRIKCLGAVESFRLLGRCLPFLTSLYLDNSLFFNLRCIGEELATLRILSVCGCGLSALHGVDLLPNIRELYASHNNIEDVLELTDLPHLAVIDLESNEISSFDSVSFLYLCTRLTSLTLRGNPIADYIDYRERMKRYIPRLKKLDPVSRKFRLIEDTCRGDENDNNRHDDDQGNFQIKISQGDSMDIDSDETEANQKAERIKFEDEAMLKRFIEDNFNTGVEEGQDQESLLMEIEGVSQNREIMENGGLENEGDSNCTSQECEEKSDDLEKDDVEVDHSADRKSACDEEDEDVEQESLKSAEEDKYCCEKHFRIFEQASKSIRYCASLQNTLPTCEKEEKETHRLQQIDGDREKRLWAKEKKDEDFEGQVQAQVSSDLNQSEHKKMHWKEGKLLQRRGTLEPSKLKEILVTKEEDIEEIPTGALPEFKTARKMSQKSAFTAQDSFTTDTEDDSSRSSNQDPFTDIRSRPSSSRSLFKRGKGRPKSSGPVRPSSSSSSGRPSSSSSQASYSQQSSVSEADSGVEISRSPTNSGHLPIIKSRAKENQFDGGHEAEGDLQELP